MKRFKYLLFTILLLFSFASPILAEGFNYNYDDDVITEKEVDGSSIALGNNVTFKNIVNGFGIVGGNNVTYNGNSEYAIIAGNSVKVDGNIQNDAAIFGNIVEVREDFKVTRDLSIFCSDLSLKGNIGRDMIIYASTVKINNVVIEGNITIHASKIELGDNVVINGTLKYSKDAETTISPICKIGNTIITEPEITTNTQTHRIMNKLYSYAGVLVTFVALVLLFPSIFKKINKKMQEIKTIDLFNVLGNGAIILIFIPFIIILLFISTIGVSLGFLLLALYIISICLTTLFTGYTLGQFIWNKWFKKENNMLLCGLIGITLITLLELIPVVRTIITILVLFFGLGIIYRLLKK